jgi:hypothetical protein
MTVQFPNNVWDGTTPSRSVANEYAAPDPKDWNQIVAELQAAQTFTLPPSATTITLNNSWTNKASFAPASYRKIGTEVKLNGSVVPGTLTNGTSILTLPIGFVPADSITLTVCPSGSDTLGTSDFPRVVVTPAGDVKIFGAAGCQSIDLANVHFHTDQ